MKDADEGGEGDEGSTWKRTLTGTMNSIRSR